MNNDHVMRPGDTFVADECGCAVTVTSGPRDENAADMAPRCCCGHEMKRQKAGSGGGSGATDNDADDNDTPRMMPD